MANLEQRHSIYVDIDANQTNGVKQHFHAYSLRVQKEKVSVLQRTETRRPFLQNPSEHTWCQKVNVNSAYSQWKNNMLLQGHADGDLPEEEEGKDYEAPPLTQSDVSIIKHTKRSDWEGRTLEPSATLIEQLSQLQKQQDEEEVAAQEKVFLVLLLSIYML